jgi:hypothetical protein
MDDWSRYKVEFRYMMLDRMRQDCNYYFGNGLQYAGNLWAKDEKTHIACMLAIWDTFEPDERPEWISREDIIDYAHAMGVTVY